MKTKVSVTTPAYIVEFGTVLLDAVDLAGDWTGRFTNSHDMELRANGILTIQLNASAETVVVQETGSGLDVYAPSGSVGLLPAADSTPVVINNF